MSNSLKTNRSQSVRHPVESVRRQPQQGRSTASLDRMLAAARALMIERGSEDFTLQEVSQLGNVSIGSIYLRFEGKDNLVRAVIADFLVDIDQAEQAMLAKLSAEALTLDEFVPRFVSAYAEILHQFAPLMRLSMQRAGHDDLVEGPGSARALLAEENCVAALLKYKKEFGGAADAHVRATATYHIIFSTLGRKLALGYTIASATTLDWDVLKRELGAMCLSYLRAK